MTVCRPPTPSTAAATGNSAIWMQFFDYHNNSFLCFISGLLRKAEAFELLVKQRKAINSEKLGYSSELIVFHSHLVYGDVGQLWIPLKIYIIMNKVCFWYLTKVQIMRQSYEKLLIVHRPVHYIKGNTHFVYNVFVLLLFRICFCFSIYLLYAHWSFGREKWLSLDTRLIKNLQT